MDKKLVELYKNFCKVNDKIIETRDSISPMCFMIGRDYSVNLVSVLFSGQEEKEKLRSRLKDFLINSNIFGYVLIFDTKVTMFDKKNKDKQPVVKDCVVRTLYTPKGNKREFVFYENNKITKKQVLDDKEVSEMSDEWDLWGKGVSEEEFNKNIGFDYQKFKMENKKLYDGVVKSFEDYHRVENKEGNLIFAYKFNHSEKSIKYYITDEFRQNGEAMKVFNLMKLSGFKIIEVDENEDDVKNG